MLLKDCPVGSVVRLVSLHGKTDYDAHYFQGTFVVFECNGVNCIKDIEGDLWDNIYDDEDFQFDIVSQPNIPTNHVRQITLDSVTYKLTPISEPRMVEIDGVIYKMEPA